MQVDEGTLGIGNDTTLTMTGGRVTIASGATMFAENVFQSGGTLTVNGVLNTGGTASGGIGDGENMTVGTLGYLMGAGTINVGGGLLTVNGTHKIGNSPGTFTVAGNYALNGTLLLDVASASSYSVLNIAGNLTLGAGSILTLAPFPGSTFNLLLNDVLTVLTWTGTRTGAFFNFNASGVTQVFNGFSFTSLYNPNSLQFTVTGVPAPVPEPSTVALMLGGLAAIAGYRRYRRRS